MRGVRVMNVLDLFSGIGGFSLGNSIVPQIAQLIGESIIKYEDIKCIQ
jgi:tRNA/tmRNA/rRNA uracil-C5-methylase (TrmA/RlmC/RlmD family)